MSLESNFTKYTKTQHTMSEIQQDKIIIKQASELQRHCKYIQRDLT